MRVLHVYHDFKPKRGGIEDHLLALVTAQAKQHRLTPSVLCANSGPVTCEDDLNGVRVIRAAAYGRYFTPFCPSWLSWLHRLQPDIVHLHLPCPLGEWALWLAAPASRLVVSLHNDYVHPKLAVQLHNPIHRAVLRRAQAIIVGAPDYAQTSTALAGLQAKVQIVPYGLDLTPYLEYWPYVVRDIDALSAGRLCYYKGIEVLLSAAPLIAGQIRIVGEGPWRKRLQAQAQRSGLGERVRFESALPEPALIARMRASRLFVFPSTERSEAFGLAQLKAMACGLPVISSDLPGVRWLNRHGETGLTVPVREPGALAAAVNQLLDNPSLWQRLAQGARARAQQFDLARTVKATTQVYASVL